MRRRQDFHRELLKTNWVSQPEFYFLTSLCIQSTFLCMKRTTLTIEDELFVQLKKRAASQGKSMASLVNDLLRQAIARQSRSQPFKLKLKGWEAELQPGVDILDRDKLFDLMNGRWWMQAIDTNILVYAEISSSPHHRVAQKVLVTLAEGAVPWAIPWPCVYEFLRVVTHPRVYHPPIPLMVVLKDLRKILDSPMLILLHETRNHLGIMMSVLEEAGISGNLIHDAHIAALCIEHGISELITGDRDFSRFPSLSVINPFS